MSKDIYIYVENYNREFREKFWMATKIARKFKTSNVYIGDQKYLYLASKLGFIKDSVIFIKSQLTRYAFKKAH